jgi:hypothetical protein
MSELIGRIAARQSDIRMADRIAAAFRLAYADS